MRVTWTVPADISVLESIAGQSLVGSYLPRHPQGELVDFGSVKINGKKTPLRVRLEGKPTLRAAVEMALAAEEAEEKAEEQRLLTNVPGLTELQAALADRSRYEAEFTEMMECESNDGARPPKAARADAAAIAEQYPRAALYVKAQAYSYASHWAKSKAGREAMEILASGGQIIDAQNKLENWLDENGINVD